MDQVNRDSIQTQQTMLIWNKFLGENLPSTGMQSYVENVPKNFDSAAIFLSLQHVIGTVFGTGRKKT